MKNSKENNGSADKNPISADKLLTVILKTITLIVFTNYLLSYYLLYNIFKINEIDIYPIITKDDIMFSFLNINIQILSLFSFSYFLLMFYWIIDANYDDIKNIFKKLYPKSCCTQILYFIIFIIIAFLLIYNLRKISPSTFVFIGVLLFPLITYLFFEKIRPYIIIIQYFTIVLGTVVIYNFAINDLKKGFVNSSNAKYYRTFHIKDEIITTSDSLKVIFHGTKFLVLKNSKNEVSIYNTNDISKTVISKDYSAPK